jgi:hypothetical protein
MNFHTYNGDGAIYEPSPIYAHQLAGYKADSKRSLALYRLRRRTAQGLNYLRLWSVFVAVSLTSLPIAYA